jgi:hypothetical protein
MFIDDFMFSGEIISGKLGNKYISIIMKNERPAKKERYKFIAKNLS